MVAACRGALAVVATALMVACGTTQTAGYVESHSASQIISDASSALKSVHSAHVTIQSTYQGSAGKFDGDIEDQNFSGTMTIGSNTLKVTIYSGKIYLYGPDLIAFAHVTDSKITARVGDKWILMPSGLIVDPKSLQAFGDFSAMADCVKSGTGFTKAGTSTTLGVAAVEIHSAAGSQIFIQVSAPHYPVRIVYATGDKACSDPNKPDSGTIDLTRIGAHFGITTPQNTTDFAALGLTPPPA
jgi:hypothetical protein